MGNGFKKSRSVRRKTILSPGQKSRGRMYRAMDEGGSGKMAKKLAW